MSTIHLQLPLTDEAVQSLRAGDLVTLSGEIYTGRDAAHKRLITLLDEGKPLPIEIAGQTIYYVGPAPASPGHATGSAGPTTSYRMDSYTPRLLQLGLKGMIGKGMRSEAVRAAMQKYGAVYFGAVGGAAALIARSIIRSEVVAYEDLGPEAIHRFTIRNFPVIVLMDAHGGNLYEEGPRLYKQEIL
ncbi:MAG: Fe-S-containing hydro-lyase [Clostridia bacterium]|nr:Fe-S-containing hydro-lyase [Clostridiales bacterium]MBQ2976555.1 Fe-S-containing hydro-lyase [Clostridia bacterium]MBQ6805600.1 Fe-S-containing hydro-lyase [Clostridia bacterium]MDD6681640.1 Fe-S-containing hydro-lyase [Clostridiales bacterium]